jgi:hypothetical protein
MTKIANPYMTLKKEPSNCFGYWNLKIICNLMLVIWNLASLIIGY